ncbi:MAG: NAD-dependent epimerase/dehydratase family protein [Patescibacteria group bacterium]|jgi:nucleoside-diphosphate-sugar epimerase/dTDP-4-dehydrorhamnose 3,5-epimerase-like enzyme
MKNVLVTGGAGYVGGAVTDLLKARGNYNFRVYDNLLYEDSYLKDVDFVFGDIADHQALAKQLAWADVVVHLAAIVGDGACTLDPDLTVKINQEAVKWLAENFNGRIIFTSTCSVYGAQAEELTEDSPAQPLSLYAGTKLNSEAYLQNKDALIFRLGTLFGVSDKYSRVRMDLVVNYMTGRAHTSGEINVFGGEQFRPLLHVKDVARAIVDNLETPHRGIFNLINQNTRMIDLAYQVRSHFPDLKVQKTETPFQDTRNYRVSGRKVKEVMGFYPQYSIDDGIREIKEALENRRIKDLSNPRYSNHLFLKETTFKNNANGEKIEPASSATKPVESPIPATNPAVPAAVVSQPILPNVKIEPQAEKAEVTIPVRISSSSMSAINPLSQSVKESVNHDQPVLIEGGLAVDDRGSISFANSFDFKDVKRFYAVDNFSLETIRAWHGHLKESKYALVITGSAIVAAVKLTDTVNPDKSALVQRFILSVKKPAVLRLPAGYANGFRALEPGTKIMFLSTATLEESKGDDYRFPADYWGSKVWEIQNR